MNIDVNDFFGQRLGNPPQETRENRERGGDEDEDSEEDEEESMELEGTNKESVNKVPVTK